MKKYYLRSRNFFSRPYKKHSAFILFLIFVFPIVCLADFDKQDWKYYKTTDKASSELSRFAVDDEIYTNSAVDLRDIRIIDQDNNETPYKVLTSIAKSRSRSYRPKMLNNSYEKGTSSTVILDLGSEYIEVNSLKINTPTENFQRNVVVYGSDNTQDWKTIKENIYIYDYTDTRGGFKSENTIINFPSSIYRYLKIEISDPENKPVQITSVSADSMVIERDKKIERSPSYKVSEVKENKTTEIYLDFENNGIPTNKIQFNIADGNFNRAIRVYSSANNENWRNVGSSYLFRYNTTKFRGDNLDISFSESKDRYIKIVVYNNDNKPLTFNGISTYSPYREFIFQSTPGLIYKIYYGGSGADFPRYDIEKYFDYLDLNTAHEIKLLEHTKNEKYDPKIKPKVTPKSEETPFLMTGGLILASVLLLFLVYKFFQKK